MSTKLIPLGLAADYVNIESDLLREYCRKGALQTAIKIRGTRWYLEKWEVEKIKKGEIDFSGLFKKK